MKLIIQKIIQYVTGKVLSLEIEHCYKETANEIVSKPTLKFTWENLRPLERLFFFLENVHDLHDSPPLASHDQG